MTLKRLLCITLITPFLLATLSTEAPAFKSMAPAKRKSEFIKFIAPQVAAINEEIKTNRARILDLRNLYIKDQALPQADEQWLRDLALSYRMPNFTVSSAKSFDQLLHRVDEIPLSLAIAQAATESGWGTSSISVHNNYFGHMCFTKGCGVKNSGRGKRLMAAKIFESPAHAVKAYMDNVNSNPAYKPLWEIRAQLRKKGKNVDGASLAHGLLRYSELGSRYVTYIKKMIRSHDLEKVDAKTA